MNQVIAAVIVLVLIVAGSVWGGYEWGQGSRDDEVAELVGRATTAEAQRDDKATALSGIRELLRTERERHARQRKAADEELTARAGRIAELELAASRRADETRKKVQTDEDCNVLARLPVCRAVVDGLWGDQRTARPH